MGARRPRSAAAAANRRRNMESLAQHQYVWTPEQLERALRHAKASVVAKHVHRGYGGSAQPWVGEEMDIVMVKSQPPSNDPDALQDSMGPEVLLARLTGALNALPPTASKRSAATDSPRAAMRKPPAAAAAAKISKARLTNIAGSLRLAVTTGESVVMKYTLMHARVASTLSSAQLSRQQWTTTLRWMISGDGQETGGRTGEHTIVLKQLGFCTKPIDPQWALPGTDMPTNLSPPRKRPTSPDAATSRMMMAAASLTGPSGASADGTATSATPSRVERQRMFEACDVFHDGWIAVEPTTRGLNSVLLLAPPCGFGPLFPQSVSPALGGSNNSPLTSQRRAVADYRCRFPNWATAVEECSRIPGFTSSFALTQIRQEVWRSLAFLEFLFSALSLHSGSYTNVDHMAVCRYLRSAMVHYLEMQEQQRQRAALHRTASTVAASAANATLVLDESTSGRREENAHPLDRASSSTSVTHNAPTTSSETDAFGRQNSLRGPSKPGSPAAMAEQQNCAAQLIEQFFGLSTLLFIPGRSSVAWKDAISIIADPVPELSHFAEAVYVATVGSPSLQNR